MGNSNDWWKNTPSNDRDYYSNYSKKKDSKEKISKMNRANFFTGYDDYEVKYLEYMVDNYGDKFMPTSGQIESIDMVNLHEPFSVDKEIMYRDWQYFFDTNTITLE